MLERPSDFTVTKGMDIVCVITIDVHRAGLPCPTPRLHSRAAPLALHETYGNNHIQIT